MDRRGVIDNNAIMLMREVKLVAMEFQMVQKKIIMVAIKR